MASCLEENIETCVRVPQGHRVYSALFSHQQQELDKVVSDKLQIVLKHKHKCYQTV